MLGLLLFCVLAWLFSIVGWRMEANYRRKLVDSIKKDFYEEIKWIKSRHYEDVMSKEIDVYKRAIKIVDAYNFDKEGEEDEEDSI